MNTERPTICTSIQEEAQGMVIERMKELANHPRVNLAEIWLDRVKDLNIAELLKDKPLPVLCVNKKPIDKGNFRGSDEELVNQLLLAAKFGAEYIAIPNYLNRNVYPFVRSTINNLKESTHRNISLIIEEHNWTDTPDWMSLEVKVLEMIIKGADVVKLALTPHNIEDVERVNLLSGVLLKQMIRHILISRGELGRSTRITTPLQGGEFMFAPTEIKGATAGGQLTVDELDAAWNNKMAVEIVKEY